MGNWNRRYLPRRKFRQDEFEDSPLSHPRPFDYHHSYSSVSKDNRVLPWEIEYCKSAKVMWNKILASKKYIVCYPSVQHWDASAGEEALHNAKRRYWAMINGLPCDTPLPDPDTFIDEIDWDPHIDPELMADIDRQLFDPDSGHNVEDNSEIINGGVESQHDKTQSTMWERDQVQGSRSSKEATQGWSRWDDSTNSKNENPWEQTCSRPVDSLKESVWKNGDGSWDRQQGTEKFSALGNYGQRKNDLWGWGHGNSGYDCKAEYFSCSRGRGWKDYGNNESWNVKESGKSQSYGHGGGSFGGGCRKRDGFHQQRSKYKSSRYHRGTL